MKTPSNRVQKNSTTNRTAIQGRAAAVGMASNGSDCNPALKILANPVHDALGQLEQAASAGATLCMMKALVLCEKVHTAEPINHDSVFLEKFSRLDFHEGISEMALEIVTQLKKSLVVWREYQTVLLEGKDFQSPSRFDIEKSIAAISFLLDTQGYILDSYYHSTEYDNCGASQCAWSVLERLRSAWKQSHNLWSQMMSVVESAPVPGTIEKAA